MSEQVKSLNKKRAARKGLITQDLKLLNSLDESKINVPLLEQYILSIESNLSLVEEYDTSICELLQDAVSNEDLELKFEEVRKFHFHVFEQLAKLKLKKAKLLKDLDSDITPAVVPPVVNKSVKLPLPPIVISPFENNLKNPFEYFNFKKTFQNALAGMPDLTNAQRLIYLKGYLQGDALKLIENIEIRDDNYELAFEQLDFHYLDKNNIIDKTLDEILNLPEVRQLKEVEPFVRLIYNKVHDLKGLNVDLLEDNSSGLVLFSKIVNRKLPRHFLVELSRETDTNYPDFNQLLSKYQTILTRLNLGWVEYSGAKPKAKTERPVVSSESAKDKSVSFKQQGNRNKSSLPVNTASPSLGKCKICPGSGHATSKCTSYVTLDERKSRALALGLCGRCLSNKHKIFECPGIKAALPYKCFSCNKSEHHGALCPLSFKVNPEGKVLNIQVDSSILVPLITLTVSRQKRSVRCSFLLDTGAQFSIINKQLVDKRVGLCLSQPMIRNVSSFDMPTKKSKGFNYPADLTLPCGKKAYCVFFAMEDFRLNIQVPMLGTIVNNLENAGYQVSPDFPRTKEDNIEVLGILGNDILQYFTHLSLERASLFGKVSARLVRLANGSIPFGSVINFLHPNEQRIFLTRLRERNSPWVEDSPVKSNSRCVNFDDEEKCSKAKAIVQSSKVVTPYKEKFLPPVDNEDDNLNVFTSRVIYNSNFDPATLEMSNVSSKSKKSLKFTPPKSLGKQNFLVQFALNPVGHQYDPLEDLFPDSNVEYGLDSFYKLESIGIREVDCPSYEKEQIDLFKNSITFKDGHYNVSLPWKSDLVSKVPSNLKISLAVAERVYEKLNTKGLVQSYEDVFNQQEELGIIEPIQNRSQGQIFIPHRPVIKMDGLTTTKIRPVFNCSLKVGKSPSLNEAAFPGIDLMNNLLSLLLYFRTNSNVVLADIMKAFLQIRLADEDDRNRFCFFRKIDGQFVPYRYNTIIFGFVSSPFILNYILQYHLQANSHLEVTSLIRSRFYVDNLILTSNQIEVLPELIKEIDEIMQAGGLPLREWTSNKSEVLSSLSEEKKCFNSEVKVLGYLYDPLEDSLKLKNSSLNIDASTKRQVLSSLASVFDPLGAFSPILLQGKLLIRKMCQLSLDWDQKLSKDLLDQWRKFCINFNNISDLSFNRKSFNTDSPVKLFLFSDASKEAFGCTIYAVQGESSRLIFSKVKVSPLKERTLPSLELLASQLALKCFRSIFEDGLFSEVKIDSIILFVDSQIVLTWLLTGKAPKRNTFVNNRLREISSLLDVIKIKFAQVSFAYVPSLQNQADMLTKPCSDSFFRDKFDSWMNGPDWLVLPPEDWPKGQLGCIPCKVKGELITPILGPAKPTPVLDICTYSSFSKLIGVAVKFFTALNKFKKSQSDPVLAATNYLIGLMQDEVFPREIEYLKNPSAALECPPLVSQFNLFLDEHGIVRSKGRIDKNVALKYHVVNPVLMPKHHHLTKLIIYYAHCSSMHMGLQSTLNFLRMHGFWILKARQAVSSVLKECVVCKRYNAPSVKYPSPASLPAARVNLSVPFAHTGVDYTGHLWIKGKDGMKVKVYILIFTCFNTRAIHLEALDSMSTAEFILAFVRFVNRYGIPSAVYSDNAKSFLQAGNIIEHLLSSSEFEEKFRISSIAHHTIPIYAAWYGATWERLIKTVKQCLFKTLGRNTPSISEFSTFLTDIQKILNNRPLTYRSSENELDIISPNHFLLGRPIPSILFGNSEQLPEWEYHEEGDYSTLLAQTLEYRDHLLLEFKERWLTEYLLNLREKDRASFQSPRSWEKGEIALFKLPSKGRPFWPLVRVVDTFPDEEQVIRTVRVAKPDKSEVVVNVKHLIPLELYSELNNPNLYDGASSQEEVSERVEESSSDEDLEFESSNARPSRKTAEASRAQIVNLARRGLL